MNSPNTLGEASARGAAYDAIILDINLPKRDGLSVVRSLRAANVRTPVLLLTSRDTTEDIIEGLDAYHSAGGPRIVDDQRRRSIRIAAVETGSPLAPVGATRLFGFSF